MPVPSDFPSTAELERVHEEHKLYQLYAGTALDPEGKTDLGKWRLKEFFENDAKKALILDRALNVASIVVDCGTDFLFGEPFKASLEKKDDGVERQPEKKLRQIIERNDLRNKLRQSSTLGQSVGHAHFELWRDDKKQAVIQEVPYPHWFPDWSGVMQGQEPEKVRLAFHLTNVDADGKETRYLYVKEYRKEGTTFVCEKSLWEEKVGKIGSQKPLSLLGISIAPGARTQGMYAIEDTGLEEMPLVTVNMRKTAMERFGQSQLRKVQTLLRELNDRITQLSIQFLKHLNAKLQVPEGTVVRDEKTGGVKSVNLEVLIARAGEPEAKYITNENPLIEQSFEHINGILRQIAKITQTPDSFLVEDEKGGVEKAESLKVRLMAFLKRVRFMESVYDPAIRKLLGLAYVIEGGKPEELEKLTLTFDNGLPKDWEADVTVWGEALASGLASPETAVSMFQGIEGKELDEELARIKAKEEQMMKSQLDLKTARPPDDGGADEE